MDSASDRQTRARPFSLRNQPQRARHHVKVSQFRQPPAEVIGRLIAAHSSPVALGEGVLYVPVRQPALHYELEQVSKTEILQKLKHRFGAKTIRDVRFRVG